MIESLFIWPQHGTRGCGPNACRQAGGFWILEELETVTLEQLLERDADLCNCFLWARSDMNNHKISYTSFAGQVEIYTNMPTMESQKADADSEQESKPELIVRSLSESFAAMNGNESLELTRRRLAFPRTIFSKAAGTFRWCFGSSRGGVASTPGHGPWRLGGFQDL